VDDIRNCGPAIFFSTEIFECWNSVFRMCSVLSNHHAPSHDIAAALADLERFKHQVSGGWWKSEDGTYIRAGEGVREMFASHSAMQHRLGWASESQLIPGKLSVSPACIYHLNSSRHCTAMPCKEAGYSIMGRNNT
jgi:hypothetical protein